MLRRFFPRVMGKMGGSVYWQSCSFLDGFGADSGPEWIVFFDDPLWIVIVLWTHDFEAMDTALNKFLAYSRNFWPFDQKITQGRCVLWKKAHCFIALVKAIAPV
ncbi:hypothetical protein [Iodidimonas muriae]|nr:hypothetical protein [Iodidimonas muriae]